MSEKICALVLAAGKGTRMHAADIPKVMFELLGEPMLHYVYAALEPVFGANVYTVVGFGEKYVREAFPGQQKRFILQEEQLGTGHALMEGWQSLASSGATHCLVINGDTPLIETTNIQELISEAELDDADLAFATITLDEPNAFGRVVRDDGAVKAIIEAKDFDPDLHGPESREVNAGVYYLRLEAVGPLLERLSTGNLSGEYYITDLVELAIESGLKVAAVECGDDLGLLGVNTPLELVEAEERLRERVVRSWLDQGVVIRQKDQVRIGPKVRIAPGCMITGPVGIYGESLLGAGSVVEAHVAIRGSIVGNGSQVREFSHLEGAEIGPECIAGPYARLRPGAVMRRGSRVGNFVEMKKAELGEGSKASHLTYLGDTIIGKEVNIGAGTITCNYDGVNKHQTVIGDNAFIGSNTALVAPVTVGAGSLVGAGSTITRDVEEGALSVARGKQVNLKRKKFPS